MTSDNESGGSGHGGGEPGAGGWSPGGAGIPLGAAPRRRVANQAADRSSGGQDAPAGAIDARVGRVDPTAGEVYSPEGVVGADEERRARDASRTPSMFLAAPGMIALLFAGMSDRMGTPGGSPVPMLLVAGVAGAIGGACFWVLSSKAESAEARLLWLLGVGAAVALLLRAVVLAV